MGTGDQKVVVVFLNSKIIHINSPIIDGVIVFQYKAQYCRSIITVMQSIDLVSMPH